mmetsp:Transcript_108068/g.345126  ORF Transcript_108068/g.345126 Transcript_108068/m.345126 type:complete len:298 (-) Transcript_108068:316-1209(-)
MDLMASLTAADRMQVASSASMVLTWMRLSEPVVGGRRDLPSKDLSCWTKRWATCTTSSSMASVTPSPSVTGKLCNGLLNAAPFVCTALPRLWKVAPKSARNTSWWPFWKAAVIGVAPSRTMLGSAPAAKRASTMGRWPPDAASSRGWPPAAPAPAAAAASGSAEAARSRITAAASPAWHAATSCWQVCGEESKFAAFSGPRELLDACLEGCLSRGTSLRRVGRSAPGIGCGAGGGDGTGGDASATCRKNPVRDCCGTVMTLLGTPSCGEPAANVTAFTEGVDMIVEACNTAVPRASQ